MQLRSIEVKDFRKLSRVAVRDLKDGLNVVVGDNEAGKSTLLAALRAVLFERHRVGGAVAERMLPYGQSVRPEITVEFELGHKPWRLRKAFCQRPEAELASNGERYTGEEVEERLAALLGFAPPGNRGSQPEQHQGIYGLLWVEQGASHNALKVGAGKGTLASALEAEVGQVLGGERGRALLERAEERRNEFWDKRGNAKGSYKSLRDDISKLVELSDDLKAQLQAYDGKVAELEAKQEALARHGREDRLNRAVQDVEKARRAVEQVKGFEAALKDASELTRRCTAERDMAAERKQAREGLVRKLNEVRASLAEAETLAVEGSSSFERHAALALKAEQELSEARRRLKALSDSVAKIERELTRRKAGEELLKLLEQLEQASIADEKRREALALAASIEVTDDDVVEVEDLQRGHDKARAQLDAASVRITFEPDANHSIKVDAVEHDAASPLRLAHDATLHLEGFGALLVRPGGGVETLARKAETAQRALDARLTEIGFAEAPEAVAALQRKRQADQDAVTYKRLVTAHAPKGLDSLRDQVERQRIAAAPSAEPPVEASEEMLARDRQELRSVEGEVEANEAATEQARTSREQEGRAQAARDARLTEAKRDHEARLHELADARSYVSDEDLQAALQQAEARLREGVSAETAARAALEEAEPEVVALNVKRAEAAEKYIREDFEQLTRQKRELEIELRALGQEGLGEQLAETEGQLSFKQRKLAGMDLEATAARLLHETLVEAQKESKDRWLGPVRERVRPYLKLVQPDTDIVLNEDTLEIESFVRNGRSEPFTGLSVGAREQVAVVTRLALAEMLLSAGQPSAVILDDALVNTDEGRLERMHLVLQKASDALQILVLTCRERDFVQLGAPIRRVS